MSEKAEIVSRAIDAYNGRDFETIRSLNHPQVEVDWSASRGPLAGVYRGLSEVIAFYREFLGAFEEVRIEPDRFIESGEAVIVPNITQARGRDGVEAIARSALVFELRGGLIPRIRLYQETSEALEGYERSR